MSFYVESVIARGNPREGELTSPGGDVLLPRSGTAEVVVAERPGTGKESFTVGRSLLTDVPPSSSLISVVATFRQNGVGRINQTTQDVYTVLRRPGRVHCSICNNVNNILLLVGTRSVSHALQSAVFRCAYLDIIWTEAESTISFGMHARRPVVRGSVQGSIDGEKRSDIIGRCRMS